LVKDLNHLYHSSPALYTYEFEWQGFDWIDCHDAEQSVLSYIRKSEDDFLIVVVNFTPVPRYGYQIGVPVEGEYWEILNSDASNYGGSGVGNGGGPLHTTPVAWMDRSYSLTLALPPLGGLVLKGPAKGVDQQLDEPTPLGGSQATGE
jgi:1,4-alpha-glucan branching enzyme